MKRGNLLVVDDEPLLLKGIKMDLEDCAERIFTAENGIEALKVLDMEEVHCVVCDINMPKMNGIEVPEKNFPVQLHHKLLKSEAVT